MKDFPIPFPEGEHKLSAGNDKHFIVAAFHDSSLC